MSGLCPTPSKVGRFGYVRHVVTQNRFSRSKRKRVGEFWRQAGEKMVGQRQKAPHFLCKSRMSIAGPGERDI